MKNIEETKKLQSKGEAAIASAELKRESENWWIDLEIQVERLKKQKPNGKLPISKRKLQVRSGTTKQTNKKKNTERKPTHRNNNNNNKVIILELAKKDDSRPNDPTIQ